jgi:hypothetical protein
MTFEPRSSLRRLRSFAPLSAGLLIAALIAGTAVAAVVSNGFFYSPRQAGYYSIHPSALVAVNGVTVTNGGYGITPQSAQLTRSSSNGCFTTGVNLPNGAVITGLAVWYSSGPIGTDPSVFFGLTRLSDGADAALVPDQPIVMNVAGRRAKAFAIPNSPARIVNNSLYVYAFQFCLGNSDAFYGARIAYTYTSAGD